MKFLLKIKMQGLSAEARELELSEDNARDMSLQFYTDYSEAVSFHEQQQKNGGWIFTVKNRQKANIFSLKTIL